MLTPNDLIKIATEEIEADPNTKKTPIRKAYDAVTSGAQAAVGAVGAGIAGLQSLNTPAPVKQIV